MSSFACESPGASLDVGNVWGGVPPHAPLGKGPAVGGECRRGSPGCAIGLPAVPPDEDQLWALQGACPGQVAQVPEMGLSQHPPWCEHTRENGKGAKGIAVALHWIPQLWG